MARQDALAAFILGIATAGCFTAAPNRVSTTQGDRGELSRISPSARPPLNDPQSRHIKDLIASLANLDRPDVGLSPNFSGTAFAPLSGHEQMQAALLTDQGLARLPALTELVSIGPDALSYLLDALDNNTPTKLVVRRATPFVPMFFSRELQVNPANADENRILATQPPHDASLDGNDSYAIAVGDVCFVVIGQIVGRNYAAVRYQPSGIVVVNSPTKDAALCSEVRAIWKSADCRNKVFNSLRTDYATADGDFQNGAAMRLLFYFPDETELRLAEDLNKTDVGKGGKSADFIHSVAWSPRPAIRAALVGVFRRADDANSLLAALPAVEDKELIRKRLAELLTNLPADDAGPYGDGYHLLQAALQYAPNNARAMFETYMRIPTPLRLDTACLALRDEKATWDVDLLSPMLSDARTFGWNYSVVPGQLEPLLPIRICDEAAVTLSHNHPALKFDQAGQYADLDRQIAAIRAALSSSGPAGSIHP